MTEHKCPVCGEVIIDNSWNFLFHHCNVSSLRLPVEKSVEIIKDTPIKKQERCTKCIFNDDTNPTSCKYGLKKGHVYGTVWYAKTVCRRFRTTNVPCDDLHPWQDKESLFCDTEFLKKFLGKEPRKGKECKDENQNPQP